MSEQHHNNTNDQEPQMNREILRTHARSPAPSDDPPVHEHPASSTANNSSNNKRPKRPFLQFSGARRTRVGDDYQVSLVPPCAAVHPHPAVPEIPVESAPQPPPSPPEGLQNTANPNDANDNTTLSTTDKDVHV